MIVLDTDVLIEVFDKRSENGDEVLRKMAVESRKAYIVSPDCEARTGHG